MQMTLLVPEDGPKNLYQLLIPDSPILILIHILPCWIPAEWWLGPA